MSISVSVRDVGSVDGAHPNSGALSGYPQEHCERIYQMPYEDLYVSLSLSDVGC